jgi:modification methylase
MDKWINQIHCGASEELIPLLPDNSIDLTITSPPYNVDLGNNKLYKQGYDVHDDNMPYAEYIDWLRKIFGSLKPKMVSGGRICINIGDQKNGSVSVHNDIVNFMTKEFGYLIKTTIIWNKHQVGSRTAWGSFKSPANPSFPTPFEYILIFCKDTQYKKGNKDLITVSKGEFIDNSLAMWEFPPHSNMNKELGHPAAFPVELPYRLIQQLSYKNDVVFDPFSGSGTTCLIAAMTGRRWIGFEKSENYARLSMKRIDKFLDQTRLF